MPKAQMDCKGLGISFASSQRVGLGTDHHTGWSLSWTFSYLRGKDLYLWTFICVHPAGDHEKSDEIHV